MVHGQRIPIERDLIRTEDDCIEYDSDVLYMSHLIVQLSTERGTTHLRIHLVTG